MTDINQLSSADTLTAGDLLPIWRTNNSDTRKTSLTTLQAYLQTNLTFPSVTGLAALGTAQTFTAQQTMTSGLVLQSVTAASIAAVANAINTTNKVTGKVVYDTTNNRLMVSSGAAAASPWYIADGSGSVTPA